MGNVNGPIFKPGMSAAQVRSTVFSSLLRGSVSFKSAIRIFNFVNNDLNQNVSNNIEATMLNAWFKGEDKIPIDTFYSNTKSVAGEEYSVNKDLKEVVCHDSRDYSSTTVRDTDGDGFADIYYSSLQRGNSVVSIHDQVNKNNPILDGKPNNGIWPAQTNMPIFENLDRDGK